MDQDRLQARPAPPNSFGPNMSLAKLLEKGERDTVLASSPSAVINRPFSANSKVMASRSDRCSSGPFCTSRLGTSRDFWAYSGPTPEVLGILDVLECSQVRQGERKEEIKPVGWLRESYLTELPTWRMAGIGVSFDTQATLKSRPARSRKSVSKCRPQNPMPLSQKHVAYAMVPDNARE